MSSALLIGNHLSRHGHTVKTCEELACRLRNAGWRIVTASDRLTPAARLADMAATIWRERRNYEAANVDVYSGRAFLWAEAAAYALRACGKPFSLTLHGGDLPRFAARWPGRVRRLLGLAAAVTTPSDYLADAVARWRPDVQRIPNAIDAGRFAPRARDRAAHRLAWLRSFHEIYDPVRAVETLADLRRDFPSATLTMMGPDKGDGSLRRCQEAARRLGLGGAVVFEGLVDKQRVHARLAEADIFLNTARIDNFPVSVVEAMAAGLCIVSTNVGGVPALAHDGDDALLVAPGDAAAMAAAARRILCEPGLAARLSANARRKAQQYDWSVVLPHWERLLGGLSQSWETAGPC